MSASLLIKVHAFVLDANEGNGPLKEVEVKSGRITTVEKTVKLQTVERPRHQVQLGTIGAFAKSSLREYFRDNEEEIRQYSISGHLIPFGCLEQMRVKNQLDVSVEGMRLMKESRGPDGAEAAAILESWNRETPVYAKLSELRGAILQLLEELPYYVSWDEVFFEPVIE
jgi:hypothetical protein